MSGCHVAIVTRCDSRADFAASPSCGYSAVGEPFGACRCSGYSAAAGEPFRRLPVDTGPTGYPTGNGEDLV